MATFHASQKRASAYELRKLHGRDWPGGVVATANRLAAKQAKGWLGSKSIRKRSLDAKIGNVET